jgi:hypothetical protein
VAKHKKENVEIQVLRDLVDRISKLEVFGAAPPGFTEELRWPVV